MKTTTCTVRFVCPAFLGDARQQAAWRTPPFKAELRHWWRVLLAGQGHAYDAIRQREANLFGNAWPDQIASKSRVRLRLSRWEAGRLVNPAPRVGQIANGKNQVDGGLYLGYGAIGYDKSTKGTRLEHEPAIDAGEAAELRIGVRLRHDQTTDVAASEIARALALMGRYGTIGGRSRNAWGSFVLESDDLAAADTGAVLLDWRTALAHEWPRGIGHDEHGPLIWRSPAEKNWQKVMHGLAQRRSDLNRAFGDKQTRALLSYPVTEKTIQEWGKDERLPNSLRLKIIPADEGVQGLIFHMPCRPKQALWDKHPYGPDRLREAWRGVHQKLDADPQLERVIA